MFLRLVLLLSLLCVASLEVQAQTNSSKVPGKTSTQPAKSKNTQKPKPAVTYPPVHLLGLRPGITYDSVQKVVRNIGEAMREVPLDTLTRNFGDQSIRIMVLDSVYVRFGYMRLALVFDASTDRLRRISITPRMSSIMNGRQDDLDVILLLYFGQTWGKPEIQLDLTPAQYRWGRGNIEVKGFIRRGYPLWVIEG